jgi:hypothetical protein
MVINSSGVMQNGLLPYDVVLTNDGDFTETNVYAVVELSFDVPIDDLSTTWTYSPSSLAFQEGYRSVGKLRSRTEELAFPTLHPGETVVFHFETGQDVNISAAARSDTASTEDITIEGTFPLDSGVSS